MNALRVTQCEVGAIVHRAGTRLLPARRCKRGHHVPRYAGGVCVACAKLQVVHWRDQRRRCGPARAQRPAQAQFFQDYGAALEDHLDRGGYLLDMGGGMYVVTDNHRTVRNLRGLDWMRRCERLQCWDEVAMRPAAAVAA